MHLFSGDVIGFVFFLNPLLSMLNGTRTCSGLVLDIYVKLVRWVEKQGKRLCSSRVMVLPITCWLLLSYHNEHHMIPHIPTLKCRRRRVLLYNKNYAQTRTQLNFSFTLSIQYMHCDAMCPSLKITKKWNERTEWRRAYELHLNAFYDWRFKNNSNYFWMCNEQYINMNIFFKNNNNNIRRTAWRLKASILFNLFVIHLIKE